MAGCVCAQSIADTIEIRKHKGSERYYYHGLKISTQQVEQIVMQNDSVYRIIQKAKTMQGVSVVLSFSGGFILGWGISSSLLAGEFMPLGVVGGIALIVTSIPFEVSFKNGMRRSIQTYNNGIRRKYLTPAN
jgi:hypothetical protein